MSSDQRVADRTLVPVAFTIMGLLSLGYGALIQSPKATRMCILLGTCSLLLALLTRMQYQETREKAGGETDQ